MARTAYQIQARIVANGGAITDDVYKATDAVSWKAGQLLTQTTAGRMGVADLTPGAPVAPIRFMAIKDHDDTLNSEGYVAVQEIDENTIIELQCNAGTASQAHVGKIVDLQQSSNIVNVNDVTADGTTFRITRVEPQWQYMRTESMEALNLVRGKLTTTVLGVA